MSKSWRRNLRIDRKRLSAWLGAVAFTLCGALALGQDIAAEADVTQAALADATQAYNDGDFLSAFSLWRPLAEAGNAEAMTNLGILARYGLGVVQDFSAALRWYQQAADQGYARGQFQLGLMHEYGLGVLQSDTDAARWYQASAVQGYVRGQFALGVLFAQGRGVPR